VANPDDIRVLMRHALNLFRARFLLYIALVAVPIVPVELAIVALGAAAPDPHDAHQNIMVIDLLARILLVLPLAQGAVSHAVVEQLAGRTPTFQGTLRAVLPRSSVLVGTAVLSTLACLVGLIALVIPFIVMLIWFQFLAPVVILENEAFAGALRRCRDLVRGHWWSTFGRLLAIGIASALLALIALLAFSAFLTPGGSDRSKLVQPLIVAIPADILVMPFSTIALTLLYLVLRRQRPPDGRG
jgi:hypothetical protein